MSQIELHKKIEEFLKTDIISADIGVAKSLIINDDSKRFFFTQADESWLDWLWKNSFLDEIKNKSKNPAAYSFRTSELDYLSKVAIKKPAEVAQIISAVKISETNFNPEVINRFLWIISALPAEQIKTLTAKIRDEKWVNLMHNFHQSGYEFDRIIKTLVDKKEGTAILELAEAILSVKSKAEIPDDKIRYTDDDPFYVGDLDASGVFEALAGLGDDLGEQALKITTGKISEIIKSAEPNDTKVFEYSDLFSLYDVDFFSLKIENDKGVSYRQDVKNLFAVAKKIIEKTIGRSCGDDKNAKQLFAYVNKIPTCRSIWRFRLFVLAQCPDIFKDELRAAFFKVFEVENYFDIEGGAEYKQTLKIAFSHLSDNDQRIYVDKVLKFFSKKEEENPKQNWHKRTGWEILSAVCSNLKNDEPQKCEQFFGSKCDENYKPIPSIGKIMTGYVSHESPANLDDYTVEEIIENLKSEWTPSKLEEKAKDDRPFKEEGIEGLGDAIKNNVKKRTNEYFNNLNGFFDRKNIYSHYVYSLLRGIEEMLRDNQSLSLEQIKQILGFFEIIKSDGERMSFERKGSGSWLADWIEVHKVMADILLFIVNDKETGESMQKANRESIKDLISYLFTIKYSPSKETEKPEYGEPYTVAINSVRGRAYEIFVVFAEKDGKDLADDVKDIYKKTLSDESTAVRFVIGRYLATFYFRDKEFIAGLFPEIFPVKNPEKKDIYLATWEGYLSNTLYDKLFIELKDYYSFAISFNPDDYTQRKYLKGLDETLAVHLALAFIYLGLNIGDPLFEQFWENKNTKRQKEFVSFIGQKCFARNQNDGEEKEHKIDNKKLLEFWDWALQNVTDPEVLSGFGFWINPDKEVLDDNIAIEKLAETIKKSDGDIEGDYGFVQRLPDLAKKNGEKILQIITNYLLDSKGNLNQHRRTPIFAIDEEIKESLSIIYRNQNQDIKKKVEELINSLIEKGSNMFWGLKDVIK